MSAIAEILAAALLLAGGLLVLLAGVGLIRLEDVFQRMHAATKASTLGLGLVVIAAFVWTESNALAEKAIMVFLFILVTAPVSAHLVGRAVYRVMTRAEREAGTPGEHPGEAG
jgi:multicomponent Na+:H+ antiporter subunit G